MVKPLQYSEFFVPYSQNYVKDLPSDLHSAAHMLLSSQVLELYPQDILQPPDR